MSTVKTNNVQIGQSVTATNNFTWYQPSSPDGTVRLGNGNSGSVTDAMTINSSGNVGIGTSSPGLILDIQKSDSTVYTTSSSGNLFRLYNTNTTSGVYSGLLLTAMGNGTLAGSASISVVQTGDGSGALTFTNRNGGTSAEKMRLDSSGNLGLGVTPSAWGSSERAIDIGNSGAISRQSDAALVLNFNSYLNASAQYIYKISSYASSYQQLAGQHKWYTAPSGTAGNAISFTQAMTLDASGNLGIGTSSPGVPLQVYKGAAGSNVAYLLNGSGYGVRVQAQTGGSGTNSMVYVDSGETLAFGTNGATERMRITTSGNVGIGTSSPSEKLQVVGTVKSNYFDTTAGSGYDAFQMGSDSVYPWYVYQHTANLYRIALDGSGNFKFNSGYGSVATAYGCRAWVNFNGTGTVAIRASGNVSSITDLGTSTYRVDFTNAMPDANYAVTATTDSAASGTLCQISAQLTTSTTVLAGTVANPAASDRATVCVAIFR